MLLRRRAFAVLLAGSLAASSAVALAPGSALADHTPAPERVSLMGTLMSELGCAADWDVACTRTDLTAGSDGSWSLTGTLPAGAYELKVRLNGSW